MLRFSHQAFSDLEEIRCRIALDSPSIAAEKSLMLAEICELLDQFPEMGRVYFGEFRWFTKEAWVILYSKTKTGIFIHRVFDGRQNWRSQFV